METEILDDNTTTRISQVEYATFGERFLAALLDFLIIIIPVGALMFFGYQSKNLMLLVGATLISGLYKPLMEGIYGATLGKMIIKIKMVDSDYDQLDLGQSFMKNAIYLVSTVIGTLTIFWVVGKVEFQEAEGFLETMASQQGSPYEIISMIWNVVILISCFAMLASDTKQTLHDRLANTFCVKRDTI